MHHFRARLWNMRIKAAMTRRDRRIQIVQTRIQRDRVLYARACDNGQLDGNVV